MKKKWEKKASLIQLITLSVLNLDDLLKVSYFLQWIKTVKYKKGSVV